MLGLSLYAKPVDLYFTLTHNKYTHTDRNLGQLEMGC